MYDDNYDDYEPGDYEDDRYEDYYSFPELNPDDFDYPEPREDNANWDDDNDQSNYEVQVCSNCGRVINHDNKSIDGVLCQACQGDGCRRLIIFDWFTGGKFFGLF